MRSLIALRFLLFVLAGMLGITGCDVEEDDDDTAWEHGPPCDVDELASKGWYCQECKPAKDYDQCPEEFEGTDYLYRCLYVYYDSTVPIGVQVWCEPDRYVAPDSDDDIGCAVGVDSSSSVTPVVSLLLLAVAAVNRRRR